MKISKNIKQFIESGKKSRFKKGHITLPIKDKEKFSKMRSKIQTKLWKNQEYKKKLILSHLGKSSGMKGKRFPKDKYPNYGLRKTRKNIIIPSKDTLIEIKIQDFLKQLKIEFFTHQYMKIEHGYQCDILIPSLNLIIECDGDYWHKYPVGRDIDKIRTKELIQRGFKVLRLWECEIKNMNLNSFQRKLKGGKNI